MHETGSTLAGWGEAWRRLNLGPAGEPAARWTTRGAHGLLGRMDMASVCGSWECIQEESAEIGRFGAGRMEIEADEREIVVRRIAKGARIVDTIAGPIDGSAVRDRPAGRTIPDLYTSGIYRDTSSERTIRCRLDTDAITLSESLTLTTSQGRIPAEISYRLELADGARLRLTLTRSTVPDDRGTVYLFRRSDTRCAWYMHLGENWAIDGDLSRHAMLISLQALANRKSPRLYFVYPPRWDFKFTPAVLEYLQSAKDFSFSRITSPEQALALFRDAPKGYVVWDRNVRTSLIVAFTIAGIRDALVVSESEIGVVQQAGLRCLVDLRGEFDGWTDARIYRWAFDRYWDECSRDSIVWLGGEHGTVMRPGVADWGMHKRAFFTDLSARRTDTEEYALSHRLLSLQNAGSYVFGWHSYAKDTEEEHVSLTSSFGLKVEGLHTLPNMSFSSQVPVSEGFEFRNNHRVGPDYDRKPEEKVYIACVQTDCLGIGAWTEPGRGEIPYAWEVTMNWVWLAPAMMEFFYTQATECDYFIGALSGPGYMYPASVPPPLLPPLIREAADLMKRLDLVVFDIMDFTRIARPEGGTPDLDRRTVEAYYEHMPDAIGFVNGYYPAQTFTVRDGRPFVSFDYYLSPTRSQDDAVSDLVELAHVNAKRPYFLLVHVRNFSDIRRVVGIIDALPDGFEIVPLDEFLVMAGRHWNFAEWYAAEEA